MGRRAQVISVGIFYFRACGFAGNKPGHAVIRQRPVLIQTSLQREALRLFIVERVNIRCALKSCKVQILCTPAALTHRIVHNRLSIQLERGRGAVMLAIHCSRHADHQTAVFGFCRFRVLAIQIKQVAHPRPIMDWKIRICFPNTSQIPIRHTVTDDKDLRELVLSHTGQGAAVLKFEFLRLIDI